MILERATGVNIGRMIYQALDGGCSRGRAGSAYPARAGAADYTERRESNQRDKKQNDYQLHGNLPLSFAVALSILGPGYWKKQSAQIPRIGTGLCL
ncbi:MAG: hypothetical protein IT209_02325 [Armatimonadetes bacterium]|nr:hypothetical protein [Armatimonadota bacterium]